MRNFGELYQKICKNNSLSLDIAGSTNGRPGRRIGENNDFKIVK